MADSLWDKIQSKTDKFLDVTKRQGLGQAISLALGKQVATEDKGIKQEWFSDYSQKIMSEEYNELDAKYEAKLEKLNKEGGEDAVNEWLDSPEGDRETNEIYGFVEAKRAETWHKTKVYDDDLFDWSSSGDDSAKVPIMGKGEKGVLMPTRPGAYGKDSKYIPLGESIMGKWLTPDKDGGLIMTDEKQEGSIERMRNIWKQGDTLEGAFANENTYNLLFEDKKGDVSIVQTSDYLHKTASRDDPLGNRQSHSGVLAMIEQLQPVNIYYQDAGMNASFYPRSHYDEGDVVPYSNTTTMMGKLKNGETFSDNNRTTPSLFGRNAMKPRLADQY